MRRSEIVVGNFVDYIGYTAEVVEVFTNGVLIECQGLGQEMVNACDLTACDFEPFNPEMWEY